MIALILFLLLGSGIVSSNNAEVLRKRSSTSSLGSSSQGIMTIALQ